MLKLQTCTCSTIYVDACMYCNGFVHLNVFLNILRDPIWFDKCSGRDTFERQFLKAFFSIFPDPSNSSNVQAGTGVCIIYYGRGFRSAC